MIQIEDLTETIISKREKMPAERSMLVGISGIDAGGKSYVAERLTTELTLTGRRCSLLSVDDWLNLPNVRFSQIDPGQHFYDNASRLDEMFRRLILPLKHDRSIHATADLSEETASTFRSERYDLDDIDIILLEGIFIFKKAYIGYFDLTIWIECGFDTALDRALMRRQESLSYEETIAAYQSIYFPAQRHHFAVDAPQPQVDIIFENN